MIEGNPIENQIFAFLKFVSLKVTHRHVVTSHAIDQSQTFRVIIELILGGCHVHAVHSGQEELHLRIAVLALQERIQEATMDL